MKTDTGIRTPEELGRLYPILLEKHNPAWFAAYEDEAALLPALFGAGNILRISHIGSTAVPGLLAKPTVDILVEVPEALDIPALTDTMEASGYIVNHAGGDIITYIKGYGPDGFVGQAYHIHVRRGGDWDELYFRDYLIAHPPAAAEYAALKASLKERYPHDRDGYTGAKGDFILLHTERAKLEFEGRYRPDVHTSTTKGGCIMKQTVLIVLPEQYADWECAFLTTALQGRILDKTSSYEVKTLSLTKDPVRSIGGFTTLPDYDLSTMPADYAALVLVGGMSWRTEEARAIAPVVKQAIADEKIVAAICDATVFLGMNGFLNDSLHTSNTLEDLSEAAAGAYTGKDRYVQEQAVRDGRLITANGTGYLEFTREMLLALDAYPADYIESNYRFFKLGYIEFMKAGNGN